MNWNSIKYIPLVLLLTVTNISLAEECTQVYSVCVDDTPRNIGGREVKPSDQPGVDHDCWQREKVYRCVDDWVSSCPNESNLIPNQGYSLIATDQVLKHFSSQYPGGNVKHSTSTEIGLVVGKTTEYARFLGYTVDCPSSEYIEDACADNENCDLASLSGYKCNAITDWYNSDSSTTYTENYSPSYTSASGVVDVNMGNVNQRKSEWVCTLDINSTCDATDVANCKKLGTVPDEDTYDPNLPSVAPLGQHAGGTTHYECEANTSTECDEDLSTCSSPFLSNPIYHPVYTGEIIGNEVQYTCFGGDPSATCDRPGGYDTCQWSYYDCHNYNENIDASENNFEGRNYETCVDWTDHYVCPSEVIVSCDRDDLDNCGPPTTVDEDLDAGDKVYHYVEEHVCYDGDLNDSCGDDSSHNFYGCTKIGFTCNESDPNHPNPDPVYGNCTEWTDEYACPNDATYVCDKELDDCRAPVVRAGSSEDSDNGETPITGPIEIGRVDDYVCWTGDVDEVCDVEVVDHTGCTHTGYTCHVSDSAKDQPNIVDGRDYEDCISWTDNWVCDLAVETSCDTEYTDCSPPDILDGNAGDVDSGPEDDTVVTNPDGHWVDWSVEYSCYTGDYVESCDVLDTVPDIKECALTGFECLESDPYKDPDPYYDTCVKWIDRYVCGHATYTDCSSDFEVCTTYELTEQEFNEDDHEIFRREVEYCYTDEINQSLCQMEDEKCYVYDENSACQAQYDQRELNITACVDDGDTLENCEDLYPEPSCRTEVECPVGDRFGVSCQIDWDTYDAEYQACLDAPNPASFCTDNVPPPSCTPEEIEYIDCPHSGFTCTKWDYGLTPEEAEDNTFEGRPYGYCVEWNDRYTCPQFQQEDCTADIDQTECGPLGYVGIQEIVDGQAVDYNTVIQCVDGAAPDCVTEPSCSLVDVECSESDGSLCTKKTQTWSCTENRTDCVEWDSTCAQANSLDFDRTNTNENNIGEFIAQASIAKMMQENTTIEAGEIRIFGGLDRQCRKIDIGNVRAMIAAALTIASLTGYMEPMAAFWMGMLALGLDFDCCKVDNTASASGGGMSAPVCGVDEDCDHGYDQGILEMLFCTSSEQELAKARGSKHVVGSLGKFCSVEVLGFCLEYKYGYCEFDNLFSRIVQEQGREQIEQALLLGPPSSETTSVSFDYYTPTPGGGWNLFTLNGNNIAFWSWDATCENYDVASNPADHVDGYLPPLCPLSDEIHIASCEGSTCFSLPITPYDLSGSDYQTTLVNAYVTESLAINRKTYVSGSCAVDANCNYTLHAYPAGGGAQTSIGYDLSWVTNTYTPGWSQFEHDMGGNTVIPYEYEGGTSALTEVDIKINGTVYSVPKDTGGVEVSVGPLSFIGSCSDQFYSCSYRVYDTVLLDLIPWGTGEEPNCRGFTVEEVEALDFGAMDLSEWIATILPEPPTEEEIATEAENSVATEKEALESGARASDGLVKAVYWDELIYHPRDTVQFRAIDRVIINADIEEVFYQVNINWGDGSPFETMSLTGSGFTATREYGFQSGPAGFDVELAFFANSGRIYNTTVRIIVGMESNTTISEHTLGGGVIALDAFAIDSNSRSGLKDATGG